MAFHKCFLLLRFRHTGDEFVTTFPLLPRSPLVHSADKKRPASRFRGKIHKGSEMPVPTNQANPKRCSILFRNGQMTALSPPLAHPRFPCHPAPSPPRSTAPARFPHSQSKIHAAAPKRSPIIQHPTFNIQHPKFQTSSRAAPFGKSPRRF